MSDKFKGKYRIKSTRLPNWDYGKDAVYFVSICTQNREHYFGEITNGVMQLSEIGKMANKYWLEISEHFPFVELDEFVVMPNHVHGIIIINKPHNKQMSNVKTPNLGVSTDQSPHTVAASEKWQPASLGLLSINTNEYVR